MSLLDKLSYEEYEAARRFPADACEALSRISKCGDITPTDGRTYGEQLLHILDWRGYSETNYRDLLHRYNCNHSQTKTQLHSKDSLVSVFSPLSKIAILIANETYKHLSRLYTPEKDCINIGNKLNQLGYLVYILKDITYKEFEEFLNVLVSVVPEKCYYTIYIAGHGAEISGVRYVLGVDAPQDYLLPCHTFTAIQIIHQVKKTNPQLCVLLIDACAKNVVWDTKYFDQHQAEDATIDGYLVIGYSSSSDQPAYEELELSCNTDSASIATRLDTAQCEAAAPVSSQYANALAKYLCKRATVSRILQRVSEELRKARRQQTPVVIESGAEKRFLFDPASGNQDEFKERLQSALARIGFKKLAILE